MTILGKYKFLFIILVVAAFLRFYKLGEVPVGPNWDEAALGYNAYSILKTGKDEYGTVFPLSLRSYDDYKPPLYMYLTVPSIAVFGLSLWATRLPAAINGIIAVIGVFFLAKEIFSYSEQLSKKKYLPYVASLLLALSPWHIQFSRIAFEANIGVSLNIFAVIFFLKGLKKQQYFVVSGVLLGLGLYAYHSQRIFAPLLVLLLSIVFRQELLKHKRSIVVLCIAGGLTIAPLVPVFLNPTTLTRLRGTSSISDTTGLLRDNVKKLERDRINNDLLGKFIDNRRFVYAKTVLNGYLSHFSLRWLFLEGDNARHHAPGMGLLYFLELPFFLVGLYVTAKNGGKVGSIILGWMLIAPVAASPTTELPHGIRTLVFLPTFQFIVSIGVVSVSDLLRMVERRKRFILYSFLSVVAVFNFLYFISAYFIQQNHEYSKYWQYGYKEAVEYASRHYDEYDKIVVSTKLEQPHMFFLFHLRFDPQQYLLQGGTASGGFAEVRNKFDKFEFRPLNWEQEERNGRILYIGSPSEISGGTLAVIYYLDKSESIKIAK